MYMCRWRILYRPWLISATINITEIRATFWFNIGYLHVTRFRSCKVLWACETTINIIEIRATLKLNIGYLQVIRMRVYKVLCACDKWHPELVRALGGLGSPTGTQRLGGVYKRPMRGSYPGCKGPPSELAHTRYMLVSLHQVVSSGSNVNYVCVCVCVYIYLSIYICLYVYMYMHMISETTGGDFLTRC